MTDPVKGSPEWIKAEQAKAGKPMGIGKGCLGCFGLIVVVALIFGGCAALGSSGDDKPSSSDNKYEAIAQCEARIEKLLKAPATADFASSATGGGSSWKVTGTVDAENGFGANVRATYGCTVAVGADSATTTVDYFDE